MMLSDVWRMSVWRLSRTSPIFMAPTATGSKARWAPQAGRVWAGAGQQSAAYRGGAISCGLAHILLKLAASCWLRQRKLSLPSVVIRGTFIMQSPCSNLQVYLTVCRQPLQLMSISRLIQVDQNRDDVPRDDALCRATQIYGRPIFSN